MTTMRTARLWKDPRTGIWKLRRRIPKRYRNVADQRSGIVKITTEHADRKAAERVLPDVLRQWENMTSEWERRLSGTSPMAVKQPLTMRQLHALAGLWYQRKLAEWDADPSTADDWDDWEESLPSEGDERGWKRFFAMFVPDAKELLAAEGVRTDAASVERLAKLISSRLAQALARYRQQEHGDYSSDPLLAKFPVWERPQKTSTANASDGRPVNLGSLFDAWKAVAVVKPRVVAETEYVVRALAAFVGHDDATRITRDDLLRWRTSMKEAGKSNNTWNNRLSMLRQVLAQAVNEGRLKEDPTTGVRLRKSRQKSPQPYSDADAVKLLRAARGETRPSLRWAHWIMAFTGMRAGEVLQLLGRDVRQDGAIWFFDVNEDDATKSVKNSQRRHVPVHPVLLREGFIGYVQTIAPDAPIFPDKRLDQHGKRGGRAWNVIGTWARSKGGIIDPNKAPDHSWRHRLEDELRAAEVPEDARDAILGHSRKTTGRRYGTRGEALSRLNRYLSKVPIPAGLFDRDLAAA
jgi:integrase